MNYFTAAMPQAEKLSPLALAYIGDAVYELAVRQYLLAKGGVYNKHLHQQTVELVRALRQSRLYDEIEDMLTAEEKDILSRGRNAKSGHQPPKVTVGDYRRATGVEALIGWLYLQGENEKLTRIFDRLFEQRSE